MARRLGVGTLLAFACGLVVGPHGSSAAAPGGRYPSPSPHASDWAHSVSRAVVRREPRDEVGAVGRLRLQTEDGPREVYPVIGRRQDSKGVVWVKVSVPGRPMGRVGWARRREFGPLHRVRTMLTIDRRTLTATLTRSRRRIWSSRVGVGARATPTPAGRFWIRERLRPANPRGLYGPWAFGTSAYSRLTEWPGGGVIGIHGTNEPWLIPGRPSHGCVRVPNLAIRRLAQILPLGTPVRIP